MKLYIVSNRLPVKVSEQEGRLLFARSEGGLATGLDSLHTDYEKHWIGWPGFCPDGEECRRKTADELEALRFHPVFLTAGQIADYYEGYSNSTIWPLCHYFFAYTRYKASYREAYRAVNRLFCETVCRLAEPGDVVWVQDYQLMLLPGMLREARPELEIGYFHHIPFPSYELFRILPERAEVLRGLLGADLVAFHTHDYMRHFISTVERVLHLDFRLDEVQLGDRVVRVNALPMGINYDLYHGASQKPEVRAAVERTRRLFGSHKLVLAVDRLDYSKGILHRLWGFAAFLEHHPEYRGQVTLAMVIVPSRDHVGSYAELKTRIDEEIGSINGKYSTMDWTPVCYFYHGFAFEELAAMYCVADVALVTPLRDGMNLVAKEYIATKTDNPGVLILSEMAGAAVELSEALQINPNDIGQIERSLVEALTMPVGEQRRRIRDMQRTICTQTVDKWAADFLEELDATRWKNERLRRKRISVGTTAAVRAAYGRAKRRLLLFDYDGTLAALRPRPEDAAPTPELLDLLRRLSGDPANRVVINSGRDHETLERWFGSMPLSLAAEHGGFYKEAGVWHKNLRSAEWDGELLTLLQRFVAKTPRARLETKQTALAWHYRQSDAWLGSLRAQQLVNHLAPLCSRLRLQIMQGDKVVEIKSPDCTKGSEVERLLAAERYDFILALGDDTTDDDMFRALPPEAVTVKVGNVSECAAHNLAAQAEVLPFLREVTRGEAGPRTAASEGRKGLRLPLGFLKGLLKNNKTRHE